MFLSKIKSLLSSFQRKLVWSLPKNQNIVILDEGGSEFIIPSLGNEKYFILKKRSTIYLKYLLAAILFDRKTKIRELSFCYNARMIKRLNPVLIITLVDNCPLHWRLDKELKNFKFLTVQNGNHWVHRPHDLSEYYHHLFFEGTPYYTHLACISKYDIDYYLKMNIEMKNVYPIGTIRSSQYMADYLPKPKVFDLCIVTNSYNCRPENIRIWNYILQYLENHNVTACLALKRKNTHDCYDIHIKGLEKFFSSSKVEVIAQDNDSTHNASDSSRVTIASYSTVLRQTFSRGNKIYPINFVHKAISSPYDLLEYPLDPTYEEFESHLDYLLALDEQEYIDRYKEMMAYLDVFDPKNPPSKKLENLIAELISDAKTSNNKNLAIKNESP